MQQINDLLLNHTQKLYRLGLIIEQELHTFQDLIEQDAGYDTPEVLQAWERFSRAHIEWQQLKSKYHILNEF